MRQTASLQRRRRRVVAGVSGKHFEPGATMGDADGVSGDAGVSSGVLRRHVLEDEMPGVDDGRHVEQIPVRDAFYVEFATFLLPTAVDLRGRSEDEGGRRKGRVN